MRELRKVALGGGRNATQPQAVRFLQGSVRNMHAWETQGSTVANAYAYVGLAFRLGGEERARQALQVLAQLEDLEGIRVAAATR